jgi:hypothetical protein
MDGEENESREDPGRDRRAGEPAPAATEDSDEDQTAGGEPGPLGNPELDEEALRHRQQDRRTD